MINRSTLIILAIVAVFGGGAIIFYSYYPLSLGGVPKIQVMPPSYNFGDIPQAPINHTFIVKNTGTAPLEIRRVSTSCGCTSAKISNERLLPNEETDFLVTFAPNLDGMVGETLIIAYIKSNDPEKPEVEVELRANVIPSKN